MVGGHAPRGTLMGDGNTGCLGEGFYSEETAGARPQGASVCLAAWGAAGGWVSGAEE